MRISIVIPVYNSLDFTKEALEKLHNAIQHAASTALVMDVVVVDDGSEDGTETWVRDNYPQVHLCKGTGNLWWSGSVNLGMEYAISYLAADYIIWWNNDIYPAPDYFEQLAKLVPETDQPVVFGSKIYIAEYPERVWSYGGVFHRFWGHSHMPRTNSPDGPPFSLPREADWLAGMGTILPRAVIERTGWLNARDFPQYHGDIDYTCRAKLAGFKIEVRPELKIWNHTSHSGISHERNIGKLLPMLHETKSLYNFRKEFLLYRKYAVSPLAYLMLLKKYAGYFVRFALNR